MGSRLEYSNLDAMAGDSPSLSPSPARQPPTPSANGIAACHWNPDDISDATGSEYSEIAPRLTAHEMALEVAACTFRMTPRDRCQPNGTAFASYCHGVTWWSFYKSQSKLPLSAQKRTMSRSLVFLLVLVIIVIIGLAVCIPTFWIQNDNRHKQDMTSRSLDQTTRRFGT